MHVILGHVRQFEIDDVRHPIDIDAAGGNVGGDKHPGLAVTKAGERSFALRLGFVPVNGGRLDAGADQVTDDAIGAVLGSGEDEHARQDLLDRAHHRAELDEEAVAGRFDYAPGILGDQWISGATMLA